MVFFAYLAIAAAMLDEIAIIIAAGAIAIHHLVLVFVAPALVFVGAADLDRVVLHAVIVIVQTVALGAGIIALRGILMRQQELQAETVAARDAQARLTAQRGVSEAIIAESRQQMLEAFMRFQAQVEPKLDLVQTAATSTGLASRDMQAAAGSAQTTALDVANCRARRRTISPRSPRRPRNCTIPPSLQSARGAAPRRRCKPPSKRPHAPKQT